MYNGIPSTIGVRAQMGKEFKSGPGITDFANKGQDLVWSLWIGRITQYTAVIYYHEQVII